MSRKCAARVLLAVMLVTTLLQFFTAGETVESSDEIRVKSFSDGGSGSGGETEGSTEEFRVKSFSDGGSGSGGETGGSSEEFRVNSFSDGGSGSGDN